MLYKAPLIQVVVRLVVLLVMVNGRAVFGQQDDLTALHNSSVRKELRLDRNQRETVENVLEWYDREWRNWYQEHYLSIPPEQRNAETRDTLLARRIALARRYYIKLKDVLRIDQRARLREIAIQYGSASLYGMIRRNPQVVAALGVTDDQKRRMAETRNLGDLFKAFQRQGEERTEALRTLTDERNKEIMDILTDRQKQKLEELKGEPFDLSPLENG